MVGYTLLFKVEAKAEYKTLKETGAKSFADIDRPGIEKNWFSRHNQQNTRYHKKSEILCRQ